MSSMSSSSSSVSSYEDILRSVPNFPNHTIETFGYPERLVRNNSKDSVVVFGPPIHFYYDFQPQRSCQVHVSGIPDWATMADIVEIFERFGKIFTIELSVSLAAESEFNFSMGYNKVWETEQFGPLSSKLNVDSNKSMSVTVCAITSALSVPKSQSSLTCNGWARVTFVSYDGAQKALFAHLAKRIPGSMTQLSIYKGWVSNVVHLKNIPANEPRGEVIAHLKDFPGLISISFLTSTTSRLVFLDLDLALLFMDIVSSGDLTIAGFTCTVEPENEEEDEEDDFDTSL